MGVCFLSPLSKYSKGGKPEVECSETPDLEKFGTSREPSWRDPFSLVVKVQSTLARSRLTKGLPDVPDVDTSTD